MSEFGKLLKKIRIERGELLYAMAKKLGVVPSFLSAVENGAKSVPVEWPQRIGALYDLSDDEITRLTAAADETAKQIRIQLSNVSPKQRTLAMEFARRFDSFEQDQIDDLLRSLQSKHEKVGDSN